MISSLLKSSSVDSGVELTAESENTNAHRTHHDAVRLMPLRFISLPILADSVTLSRIEDTARGFLFNGANFVSSIRGHRGEQSRTHLHQVRSELIPCRRSVC